MAETSLKNLLALLAPYMRAALALRPVTTGAAGAAEAPWLEAAACWKARKASLAGRRGEEAGLHHDSIISLCTYVSCVSLEKRDRLFP